MNIEKITAIVPIFGTGGPNGRKHNPVKNLQALQNTGVNFDTYTIREGETLRFPKFEDMEVEEVEVNRNRPGVTFYIVKCESEFNGVKKPTWFGLPALYKRDAKNTPVQPTWYDLGNNLERLKKLAEVGEITGLKTVKIQVPVFDVDGKRVQTTQYNPDGTPVMKDGQEVLVDQTKEQSVVVFTEYVAAEE